jgi:hypothetical protein
MEGTAHRKTFQAWDVGAQDAYISEMTAAGWVLVNVEDNREERTLVFRLKA